MINVRFSIIITYYQGTQSNYELQRMLDSLKAQSYEDFEVLVLHDGPLMRGWGVDVEGLNIRLLVTKERYNDWGHSLRDTGIGLAEGEFLLHTNADNVYYPDALLNFDRQIRNHRGKEVILARVKMMGMKLVRINDEVTRVLYPEPRDYSNVTTLPGRPIKDHVDIMQACISKRIWVGVGGWYDKSINSDGEIIVNICKSNRWLETRFVVGEHY